MSKYQGLKNQGATCYMNSLLQTLFMTPQFRQQLYKYRYNQQIQSEKQDSIPYQLQQIFVRLQASQNRVQTKKLIKSFQWNSNQSFEQHDVQEFCRVLFQSIETSQQNSDWIKNLYQGTLVSFVKCANGHQSQRYQKFLDISLTIKNPYQNKAYNSLQEALKAYFKTQKLQFGNQYYCEACDKKVDATKGFRLQMIPPILSIQLSRFQLNYQTMMRQKINQFVYFPQILQLWRFQKSYQQIEINPIPQGLMQNRKKQYPKKTEKSRNSQWVDFTLQNPLQQKIRKKSQEKQGNQKQIITYVDDDILKQKQSNNLTEEQKKLRNIQMLKNLQLTRGQIDQKLQRIQKKKQLKKIKKQPQIIKPKQSQFQLDQLVFGIGGAMISQATNWQQMTDIKKPTQAKPQKAKFIHIQKKFDPSLQYLPNTYILTSVLVHQGGALGGHYYAYIYDGNDWYKFNDSNVTKVDRQQIQKYGDVQDQKYGGSAYMLFYKQASLLKTTKQILVPQDLKKNLIEQIQNQKSKPVIQSKNHYSPSNNYNPKQTIILKLRVYSDANTVQMIDDIDRFSMKYSELKQYVKILFNIEEQDQNWRLRRYNHYQDTPLDPFHNDYATLNKNLAQIGFKDYVELIIQKKKSDQVFEIYDPRLITLKLNVWRQGLTILSEANLNPSKLALRDDQSFSVFVTKLKQVTRIQNPIIIKRTFTSGTNSFQILSKQQNMAKTLLNLRFFNNLNLFIQAVRDSTSKLLWQEQFESQKHRFLVKFNNPFVDNSQHEFYFDNRKTFNQLKFKLSQFIKLPINQFRVKRSNKTMPEIIQLRKRCIDLRMIHSQNLFLQIGRSTKGLIKISKGLVLDNQDSLEFIRQAQQQYQLDNNKTLIHLKQQIGKKYELLPENIRVRQFKTGRFGQIYKDTDSIEKLNKTILVWQQICQIQRGISIYVRKYDSNNLFLGRMQQIFVQYYATYQQLAMYLSQNFEIDAEKIQVYSVISNMFQATQLIEAQWHNIFSIQGKISDPPLYITTDGSYLIIKSGNKAAKKTKAIISDTGFIPYLSNTGLPKEKKQKALKITVKTRKGQQKTEQKKTVVNQTVQVSLSNQQQKHEILQQKPKQQQLQKVDNTQKS